MQIEKNLNDKTIVLFHGDITELKTQAVVNGANAHLWIDLDVAEAIKTKDEDEIEKYIRDTTSNSLKKAEELNLSSIAFHVLGTEVEGCPVDKCANAMLSTTAGFFRDNQYVKEVYFVLSRKNDYDVFTLVLEKVWNDFQWSLERIEGKQRFFCFMSKKEFESYYKLLNESEEILIQAMSVSRGFYHTKKDEEFNQAFCMLSSYIIEDTQAVKVLMPNGLFTPSSILLRHVYTCHLTVMFLRNFPDYINEWLEESKKGLFSTGKNINPNFKEWNMRDMLDQKGEKTGYSLFTVLSKAVHGSTIWGFPFQDLNIFAFPGQESILKCKALLATFSEYLCMTVGEFLIKYQSEIKTNDDIKILKFRYDELYKKHQIFRNELNSEIGKQLG
jgi:O-acetyl-ADP-ribose deacetylase (regulator of RNase III)